MRLTKFAIIPLIVAISGADEPKKIATPYPELIVWDLAGKFESPESLATTRRPRNFTSPMS